MNYKYKITNDYILDDLKIDITKILNKYMKKDRHSLEYVHEYIKDVKNKFCRDTEFSEFLVWYDDYFLLYDENELFAGTAITFNLNSKEDDILGINLVYFCSKKTGYGKKLLTKIIEVSNDNNWYLKLSAGPNNYKFYEKYGFEKESDGYHYYYPKH